MCQIILTGASFQPLAQSARREGSKRLVILTMRSVSYCPQPSLNTTQAMMLQGSVDVTAGQPARAPPWQYNNAEQAWRCSAVACKA